MKVKVGQDVDILVEAKRKLRNMKQVNLQGPLPEEELDYSLSRRLLSGGITFYDLGRILVDGVPEDIVFNVPVTLSYSPSNSEPNPNDPQMSDYQALATQIISGNVDTLKDRFWKIDQEGGRYASIKVQNNFTIMANTEDENDTHWSGGKLTLSPAELAVEKFKIVPNTLLHEVFQLTGTGKNKITDTNNYSAPAVSFTPKSDDTYFLFPQISHGWSEGLKASPADLHYFIGDHRVFPRSTFLTAGYFFRGTNFASVNMPTDAETYALLLALIELVRSKSSNLQYVKRTHDGTNWNTTVLDPVDYPPVDLFPPAGPTVDAYSLLAGYVIFFPMYTGNLIAIIKQGTNYYYVWK